MFGEDGMIKTVTETFNDRMKSTMYGTFVVSWILWNWKVIYITFFINQDLILGSLNKLKVDYIVGLYSWSSLGDYTVSLGKLFIGPAISSFVIVWWLSKLDFYFFRRSYTNKMKIEQEKTDQQNKLQSSKFEVIENKKKVIDAEKNFEITKDKDWGKDYDQLAKESFFKLYLQKLQECLYGGSGFSRNLDSSALAFLHTNELVTFLDDSKRLIDATEKGKYFLRRHINEVNKF